MAQSHPLRSLALGDRTYRTTGGSRDILRGTRASRIVPGLLQNEIAPRHDTLEIFYHPLNHRLVFI